MKVILFAALASLACASSEYRINGAVDPFTLTPTYYLSYHVDDEFIFGAKGQDNFDCCNEQTKETIREDMARSTELCKDESKWAPMSAGGATVVLQEATDGTGCSPMPCTNIYGTLHCDSEDVAGCDKVKARMQQTVDAAKIVDVSTDDSGFHPLFKITGSDSFSFNFNGEDLVVAPCMKDHPFSSAQAGIDAVKKAVKESTLSFVPAVPWGNPSLQYTNLLADGKCVGTFHPFGRYAVMKILLRYAEKAPVTHSSKNAVLQSSLAPNDSTEPVLYISAETPQKLFPQSWDISLYHKAVSPNPLVYTSQDTEAKAHATARRILSCTQASCSIIKVECPQPTIGPCPPSYYLVEGNDLTRAIAQVGVDKPGLSAILNVTQQITAPTTRLYCVCPKPGAPAGSGEIDYYSCNRTEFDLVSKSESTKCGPSAPKTRDEVADVTAYMV